MADRSGTTLNKNGVTLKCMDCDVDLNSSSGRQPRSIECDFCHNMYCQKCSKLKQSLFNELSKPHDTGLMWNCLHCRIALPGIRDITTRLTNLEAKMEDFVHKEVNGPATNKEVIREMVREVKKEEEEIELRKLNIIVHSLKEHGSENLDECKQADQEALNDLVINTLNLNVQIEKVTRLGRKTAGKPRPLKFTVKDFDTKRKIMNASKTLKNHKNYSSVFLTPDLTQTQREEAFKLREEKRRREKNGERNLVIRRGKIVTMNARADHSYFRTGSTQEESSHQGATGGNRSPIRRDRSPFH